MAVLKLSQIAPAGGNPAVTDQAVFVTGGTTDNLVTVTQLAAGLPAFTAALKGSVPASGGGTTNFLRADGTWQAPPAGAPGGANTQFQFNNLGAFGGTVGYTWDATNQAATLASIANPAASTLTLTGGTALTTNQPVLNMTQTWNNVATTFNGLVLNVTSTASATSSRVINVQVAGAPVFSIDTTGLNFIPFGINVGSGAFTVSVSGNVVLNSGSQTISWFGNVALTTDGAGLFAQRNATNAQTIRIYNTFTDSNNYERGVLDWTTSANTLIIGTQNAGTGSARACNIVTGGTNAITISTAQAVAFPGVGTTASAANAFLDNAANNNLLRSTSSLRYKTDVREVPWERVSIIAQLRPIEYQSLACADNPNTRFVGYAAEEVAAIDPALVSIDSEGRPDGVMYDRVLLLKIAALEQRIKELEQRMN